MNNIRIGRLSCNLLFIDFWKDRAMIFHVSVHEFIPWKRICLGPLAWICTLIRTLNSYSFFINLYTGVGMKLNDIRVKYEWYDEERFQQGQAFFRRHKTACWMIMRCGVMNSASGLLWNHLSSMMYPQQPWVHTNVMVMRDVTSLIVGLMIYGLKPVRHTVYLKLFVKSI